VEKFARLGRPPAAVWIFGPRQTRCTMRAGGARAFFPAMHEPINAFPAPTSSVDEAPGRMTWREAISGRTYGNTAEGLFAPTNRACINGAFLARDPTSSPELAGTWWISEKRPAPRGSGGGAWAARKLIFSTPRGQYVGEVDEGDRPRALLDGVYTSRGRTLRGKARAARIPFPVRKHNLDPGQSLARSSKRHAGRTWRTGAPPRHCRPWWVRAGTERSPKATSI